EFDGQIAWVYRHFPLDSIHPRARPAALAAECVASLGGNDAFWNYVDKLFEGAPVTLTDDQLKTIAAGLGVNASQFDDCFKSRQFEDKINADLQDGQNGGITGTPGTIVIDGKGGKQLIPGALPYEQVKGIIEEVLKN
ncbi:thioredoxin domain-containing protein, partial [Candidatus Microgenomates bacterium]|nr:thioredoxin domain-containing protein [Candidatus Microgenomates bacterium]